MNNLKQDEREKLQNWAHDILVGYHGPSVLSNFKGKEYTLAGARRAIADYVLANYILKTEATAAQERAVAEAVANHTDLLANRLYVALQEQHTMLMQTYGVSVSRPPTKEDAYLELAAPQNRGEG